VRVLLAQSTEMTVKKILMCLMACGALLANPIGDAEAAAKKKTMSKEQRALLTKQAREACRKKFGGGVTLQNIEFYNGKIKRIWCF
jgi:hypothetical protein